MIDNVEEAIVITILDNNKQLYEQIEKCAGLSASVLNGDDIQLYVAELLVLKNVLHETSEEIIKTLPYEQNLITTILGDKVMMRTAITKEADQISLLSTLVTYTQCKHEGMKEHSREYMDRVTKLRLKIDEYYGDRSQKFCGS